MRRTRDLSVAGAAICAALVTTAVAVPSAGAATTTLWRAVPTCAAPRAGHAACFAERLVPHRVLAADAAAIGRRTGMQARPFSASGPAGGYSPADLAKSYGVSPDSSAASGLTVGIVDAYDNPTVKTDLAAFDKKYGIAKETATSFKVVNQTGGSTLPTANSGWAGEIDLDVQAVRGLCRKCKIVLVEANSAAWTDLAAGVTEATSLGAKIVSSSFGGAESGAGGALTTAYGKPGVVYTVSTGDHGYYDWDWVNGGASTPSGESAEPASLNTVVGVGGTSLYVNGSGSRVSEQVWNNDGPADRYGNPSFGLGAALGAAGSGCSALNTAQQWQRKVAGYSSLGCASGKRSEVDIAADADPFTGYDIFQTYPSATGAWTTYGGTSLASPLVAAMWALAGGPGGVKHPALSLYGHFRSAPSSLYDVQIGGTGFCSTASPKSCAASFGESPNQVASSYPDLDCGFASGGATVLAHRTQCYAAKGYDGVSGVGTPNGTTVFKPMNPTAAMKVPGSVKHGKSASFDASASSDPFPGGSITKYAWTWGDGKTSTGAKPTHTYGKAGKQTVTLTVTDNYGRTATKSVTITVA